VSSASVPDALAPLRADPAGSAVLLDVDGTLAPIVENASDASVPEPTRRLLISIARRYGLVACVSGRRATDARAMVSLGQITYIGSHGAELLQSGWTEPVLDPLVGEWVERIATFRRRVDTPALRRSRVRVEDKGPIVAFHWRGAGDEEAARAAIDELARSAEQAGFEVHWGRKVMEARPPVRIDKGEGVTALLTRTGQRLAMYAGDDLTDLDAFRALRRLEESGALQRAVCVGVRSEEGPAEVVSESDLVVDGPDGLRELLAVLAADGAP
jgi:trehalose 6-phosphate phosphatase